MSSLTRIKTDEASWDVYVTERDEFLLSIEFANEDSIRKSCDLLWTDGDVQGQLSEYEEAFRFALLEGLFEQNFAQIKTVVPVTDDKTISVVTAAGFRPGREFGVLPKRYRRFSCDRYDLVIEAAQLLMGEHLDIAKWSFAFDSAKKRLGACKWQSHEISLSRYFVDLHSLDEIRQVLLHEIAHALAGSKAGHSRKWKDIATNIGYRHEKISGDEIGNATAKLIGTCPNGHTAYRHRKPRSELSCSRCAKSFDRKFLITWVSR